MGYGRGASHGGNLSLKLTDYLDAQLTEQSHRRRLSKSELVRRALTAFLQYSDQSVVGSAPQSAGDLLADLVGCCENGPAHLSFNPVHLFATTLRL
jgi:hypothetical protein